MPLPFTTLRFHWRPWFTLVVMVLAAVAAYYPAISGGIIWDDRFLVGENPFFRTLTAAGLAFGHPLYPFSAAAYYRPLQNVSYALDYQIYGSGLVGYHLTNIGLHALAAFLFWKLLRRLLPILTPAWSSLRQQWVAALASALWLLHPMHHAGVAYISGRADSLTAVLALAAWLLFLAGRDRLATSGARIGLWLSAALTILAALHAKEIAAVWLALFVLFLWIERPPGESGWVRLGTTLAVVLILSGYAWHRSTVLAGVTIPPPEVRPLGDRALLAVQALGDYLRVVVWPADLHMERRITPWVSAMPGVPDAPRFFHPLTLLGLGALLGAAALASVRGSGRRLRRWGLVWFLVGFLPISNLFPLNAEVAEHWIYMPSLGLLLALTALLPEPSMTRPKWLVPAAALGLLALGIRTSQQSAVWTSEEKFFRLTMAAGGDSARLSSNWASLLMRQGDRAGARRELERARLRFPASGMLSVQMASLDLAEHRVDEAKAILAGLPPVPQEPWQPALLTARIALIEHDFATALRTLDTASERWPGRWDLTVLRAATCEEAQRPGAALQILIDYLEDHPWHMVARLEFARHLAANDHLEAAAEQYRQAADCDRLDPVPWSALAEIRLRQQRFQEAMQAQTAAIHRSGPAESGRARLAEIQVMAAQADPKTQLPGL